MSFLTSVYKGTVFFTVLAEVGGGVLGKVWAVSIIIILPVWWRRCEVILPVDAGDVNDGVDHVAAQLVRWHVHGTAVCGNVNLTNHVEQEGLFNTRILRKHTESIILREVHDFRFGCKWSVQKIISRLLFPEYVIKWAFLDGSGFSQHSWFLLAFCGSQKSHSAPLHHR